jgi:hypothetical protein
LRRSLLVKYLDNNDIETDKGLPKRMSTANSNNNSTSNKSFLGCISDSELPFQNKSSSCCGKNYKSNDSSHDTSMNLNCISSGSGGGGNSGITGLNNSGSSNYTADTTAPFNVKDLEEQDERDLRRHEIQCELNSQGASDLVVDLFMSDISNKVFKENVLLAIALLEGGNTQVQKTIYTRLTHEKSSEKFCKTFHDRIEVALREIKNANSFMSGDINDGNYKH